ncbi:MAG: hypothetical protein AB8G11_01605 [Saprospiraceae bacterium]
MKHLRLLLLFAMLSFIQFTALGQTVVTIGSGSSNGGNGDQAGPIYRFSASSGNNYSRHVMLYTEADLRAQGLYAGVEITKIAWYKTSSHTMSSGRTASMNILMQNSDKTSISSDEWDNLVSKMSTVYSNSSVDNNDIPNAVGWVEFTLTNPIVYNGGSLEIATDWAVNSGSGNSTTGAFTWRYTSTGSTQALGHRKSSSISGTTSIATAYSRNMNLQLTYTPLVPQATPLTEGFESNSYGIFKEFSARRGETNVEGAAANSGSYGARLSGKFSSGWTGGGSTTTATNAWIDNLAQHSSLNVLVDATNATSINLEFDLKQTYSYGAKYSWFRVMVNGTQIGSDYNPTTQNSDPFTTINMDLSAYAGTTFDLSFQFAGKYSDSGGNSGNGDKAFLDNVSISCDKVTTLPHTENFDNLTPVSGSISGCQATSSLNGCWSNDYANTNMWIVRSASTTSNSTGPTSDHTTGSGNFIYLEASICNSNTSYFYSTEYDVSSLGTPELSFWYHMYGADMGSLSIEVSTDGGNSWSASVWSLSGD